MNVVLINNEGVYKQVSLENDLVLIVLSIFSIGWIKLFIDGRIASGFINLALTYTLIGGLIHGIYLGLKPEKAIIDFMSKGYQAQSSEDAKLIKQYTGLNIEVRN